ncbi:phosphoadenosine phosphosulfate reductase [Candidatus Phycosocius spiralis]|uniref:Adenosine 5'-phosphosulfate reductase n=1 Tax=Candidatus Phycosocius spiralis TaxID=2815099 RepID=A0ABQ4PUG4_9PROT|nr:phosphoadenosine phosphosulfate reductase [Candidatus Phycosocius spiralis]
MRHHVELPEILASKITKLEASLRSICEYDGGNVVLATSFSAEDMVLTDALVRWDLPIGLISLETKRLHPETQTMIARTQEHYGIKVDVYEPEPNAVDEYVTTYGLNGFYDSLEARRACCDFRKSQPLRRALIGRSAWITGQRREQSLTRRQLAEREIDATHNMIKYNPLVEWLWTDVLDYVELYRLPINPLYARGYVSIGCEPCTRALRPGEHPRAGRWWWESATTKECGLHQNLSPVDTE